MKKSDDSIVAMNAANKGDDTLAEQAGAKAVARGEIARSYHAPGAEMGSRVTGEGAVTGVREAKPRGASHDVTAPCQHGSA